VRTSDRDQVEDSRDAAKIVKEMCGDLKARPKEWENHDLQRFLHALAEVLGDLEGEYARMGTVLPTPPTWSVFTEVLVRATGYER
jgi:hypothetical protein